MAIDSEPKNNSAATADMLGILSGTTNGAALNFFIGPRTVQSISGTQLAGHGATHGATDPIDYVGFQVGSDVQTVRFDPGLIAAPSINAGGVVGSILHVEYRLGGSISGQPIVIEAKVGYVRYETRYVPLRDEANGVLASLQFGVSTGDPYAKADSNRLVHIFNEFQKLSEVGNKNVTPAGAQQIAQTIQAIVAQGGSTGYSAEINTIGNSLAAMAQHWFEAEYTLDRGAGAQVVSATALTSFVFNASSGQATVSVAGYTATMSSTGVSTPVKYKVSPLNVAGAEIKIASFTNGITPIFGTSGPDDLSGNYYAKNVIFGGGGNDNIAGGREDDILDGGEGNDRISMGVGSDIVRGGAGYDVALIDGSRANYGINYDAVTAALIFFFSPSFPTDDYPMWVNHISGVEEIAFYDATIHVQYGTTAANKMVGDAGENIMIGFAGNDTLDGKAGADFMVGGTGNDIYYVDNGGDRVLEAAGEGADTVNSSVDFTLGANVENLKLLGTAGLNATGNDANNVLTGNAGSNYLDGLGGADQMKGGAGDDFYFVDNVGDKVIESANQGHDTVYSSVSFVLPANVEDLWLQGEANINATGNAQANLIMGNAADNVINGGGGSDRLWGAPGSDTFVFNSKLGPGNVDLIGDFSVGEDTIELENAIFTGLKSGVLEASAFTIGTAAADALDRIIYDSTSGAMYFDKDGSGKAAAVLFATLTPGLALTNEDFFVI